MRNKTLWAVLAIIIVALVIYAFTGSRRGNESTQNNNQTNLGGSQQPGLPEASSTPQSSTIKTINISGQEFSFAPSQITVNNGETVRVIFTNNGTMPHNWAVDEFNAKTDVISPGNTAEVTFIANKTGAFPFYCSVPGHADRGMVGQLIVK